MIWRKVPTCVWSYLHRVTTPFLHHKQNLAEQPVTTSATVAMAAFPFTKDNNQPPASTTHTDHVSTLHDKSALELGQGGRVWEERGLKSPGRLLASELHGTFCRERITWHCQRVINCFRNRMEKLGLRCFLQLVKKTSQSHEVQFICSIFKEPGWKKKTCYLETIQQSLYVEWLW